MTLKEVAEIAAAMGIPWSYDHFETEPAPPYLVYYYPSENDFVADGENYANVRALTFELVTSEKDFELEAAIEAELRAADIVWYKATDYINDEKVFMTTYETEVIINEQQG